MGLMGFRDYMIADVDVLGGGEFSEPVVYSKTGKRVMAVVDRGRTADKGNTFVSEGVANRALIAVAKNTAPDPRPGERFTDETGVEWEITHRASEDPAMVILECITDERVIF